MCWVNVDTMLAFFGCVKKLSTCYISGKLPIALVNLNKITKLKLLIINTWLVSDLQRNFTEISGII